MDNIFRSREKRRRALRGNRSLVLENLEARRVMSGTPLDIETITWKGRHVDAIRDEWVFSTAATNPPQLAAGWSSRSLGSGFFELTAPGASADAVRTWASAVGVASLDPNAILRPMATPNDTLYTDPTNWAMSKISAPKAWDISTGSTSVVVAVLDSGVDYNHADLKGNMWTDPKTSTPSTPVYGFDAADNDANPLDDAYYDTILGRASLAGHGTNVAGIIGAVGNNAAGMAGMNWSTRIMAVKVAKTDQSSYADSSLVYDSAAVISGIDYVLARKQEGNNVVAINCSFDRPDSPVLQAAFKKATDAGILVVCAAGNGGTDSIGDNLDDSGGESDVYPAEYAFPNIITVAATDQTDALLTSSNYGARSVDLAAPGSGVLTTMAGLQSAFTVDSVVSGGYAAVSGTSFATAYVTGAVALLKAAVPSATAGQVKNALLSSVDKAAGLGGKVLSGGRLNVGAAMTTLTSPAGRLPNFTATSTATVEGNSGYTYVDVTLTLDRPSVAGKPATVAFRTDSDTAIAGIDFVQQSGVVTFGGNQMEAKVRLKVIGDRLPEKSESFILIFDKVKSQNVIVGTDFITVSVVDDDQASPTPPGAGDTSLPLLTIEPKKDAAGKVIPVIEGQKATFVAKLDKSSPKAITASYRTSDPVYIGDGTAKAGEDYIPVSGQLVFKPGQREIEFSIQTLTDRKAEGSEVFDIILSTPVNCRIGATKLVGTIGEATTSTPPAPAPGSGGFTITVKFSDNSLTSSQQAVFQQAAARWSEIITGDLPDVTDTDGTVIDDVQIDASAPAIDGVGGILGQAGPRAVRSGPGGLPYKGAMQFDSADVANMESNGTFSSVILHEMAHVLGVGTLWQNFNLLVGAGTNNPVFTGSNAVREYNSIFGTSATGVPVENAGGQGTRDGHWRESVFKTELMTGYAERPGTPMPISRITVGQFQDLGYTVDYAKADSYSKPVTAAAAAAATAGAGSFRFITPVTQPTSKPAASQAAKPPAAQVPAKLVASEVRSLAPAVPAASPARNSVAPAPQPGKIVAKVSAFASLGAVGIS